MQLSALTIVLELREKRTAAAAIAAIAAAAAAAAQGLTLVPTSAPTSAQLKLFCPQCNPA